MTAEFFYITYVTVVIMFMLTIFMSILNNSITAVRLQNAKHAVMFGMIKVLKKSVREVFEFFFPPRRKDLKGKFPFKGAVLSLSFLSYIDLLKMKGSVLRYSKKIKF